MKLINHYNRYILTVMSFIFILSSVITYLSIRQILLHELDDSLLKEQYRIESYIKQFQKMPIINSFNYGKIRIQQVTKSKLDPTFKTIIVQNSRTNKKSIYREIRFVSTLGNKHYLFAISNELEGTRHIIKLVLISTSLTILVIIFFSFLSNMLIMNRIWKPFYHILAEIKDFKISNEEPPNFINTNVDEFNLMINSLNIAIGNAVANYKNLKQFTEDASHEIQTPIAIIRSKLDLLVQHKGLNELEATSLKSAYGAIKKLSLLNKDLLLITKIENHQYKTKEKLNLISILEQKVIEFKEIWELKEIELTLRLQDSELLISADLIEILINNLLSNATKHNYPSGKINIALSPNRLIISNTGTNQALNQDKIFRRFYKVNNSTENNGLGLSIIKQICESSEIIITYQFDASLHSFEFNW